MTFSCGIGRGVPLAVAALIAFAGSSSGQESAFRQVVAPKPPPHMNGGEWGELIQVRIDRDDNVWVLHRCFKAVLGDPGVAPGHSDGLTADCVGAWAVHPPILKFSATGEYLAGFGVGLFARPHGFDVDAEGNVWVTDVALVPGEMGAVVTKLNPQGEVLLTLGTPGTVGETPTTFNRPSGVAVAPSGDVYVTDGEGPNNRVVRFSKDGQFLGAWGTTGSGPGQFRTPHDLAIDARGRVFVADRTNSRVQIFDPEGNFIEDWRQFGRPSGIFVNRATDMLYVTDSQSNASMNPGFLRGAYVGSARTGEVLYFIPDPDQDRADDTRISGASGIAASADDRTVYLADVAPRQLRKYVRP